MTPWWASRYTYCKNYKADNMLIPWNGSTGGVPDANAMNQELNRRNTGVYISNPAIIGLSLAIILPWLFLGLIVIRGLPNTTSTVSRESKSKQSVELAAVAANYDHEVKAGPWGVLHEKTRVLDLPSVLSDFDIDLQSYKRWIFKDSTIESIHHMFTQVGLDEKSMDCLLKTASADTNINGFVIQPPDAVVLGFSSQVRDKLYRAIDMAVAWG
jgi:hypothetical protein